MTNTTNTQLNPHAQSCLQSLLSIWLDFEKQLNRTEVIKKINFSTLQVSEYQCLLLNLRQQVIEGSRWISRAASSFDRAYADVRSMIIGHAKEEHRDYQLLEQDYVAAGGLLSDIENAKKNIGSEALHGYMMHKSSEPNPIGLIGAMWIIEGLGEKMAHDWANKINDLLKLSKSATQFMSYHADNDDSHMEKLYTMIDRVCVSDKDVEDITMTAKVVARLYCLQIEAISYD